MMIDTGMNVVHGNEEVCDEIEDQMCDKCDLNADQVCDLNEDHVNDEEDQVNEEKKDQVNDEKKDQVNDEDDVCDLFYEDYPGQSEEATKALIALQKNKKRKYVPEYECCVHSVSETDSDLPHYVKLLRRNPCFHPVKVKVVRRYLKQVEDSEGFDVEDFPGYIEGITTVRPLKTHLSRSGRASEDYKKMMDFASLAVDVYNKENGTRFKPVKIEKLTVASCKTDDYYITFSVAVDGDCSKDCETADHKNLQAIVSDDEIDGTVEVVFCRDAK